MDAPGFREHLRRAHLPRILLAYGAGAWLILQIVDVLVDGLSLPAWVTPVVVILLLIGLLVVAATAWVVARRPEGPSGSPGAWSLDVRGAARDVGRRRLPALTWPRALLGGLVAFGALAGLTGAVMLLRGPVIGVQPGDSAAPGVAVLPFRTAGPGLEMWRDGVPELLATNLESATGLRKIDPSSFMDRESMGTVADAGIDELMALTRATGARYAVTGSVVGRGPDVRLTARTHDLGSGQALGSARVDGPADSLFSLIDALSVEILRSGLLPGDPELPRFDVGRVTTSSLEALRHYVAGERAYRRSQWQDAIGHFTEAVEEDPDFPLALYRLSLAHNWDGSDQAAREYADRALGFVDRLPERERLLLRGHALLMEGDPAAIDTLEVMVQRYPDDVEAWQAFGNARYRLGPIRLLDGGSFRRPMARAAELNPHFGPSYPRLIEDAFTRQDTTDLARWIRGYRRIDDTADFCIGYEFAYRLRWGDEETRRRTVSALDTLHSDPLACVALSLTYDPDASAEYELVNAERGRRDSWVTIHGDGRWSHVIHLASRGRFRESIEVIRELARIYETPGWVARATAEWGLLSGSPVDPAAARPGLSEDPTPLNRFWLGAVAAGQGDIEGARAGAAALDSLADTVDPDSRDASDMRAFARSIRGLALLVEERYAEGAEALEAALPNLPIHRQGSAAQLHVRHRLAEAYLQSGSPERALRVADSFVYRELDYRPHVELLRGRARESLGDLAAARRHYDNVWRWWEDADPPLQELRRSARQSLERLAEEPGAP